MCISYSDCPQVQKAVEDLRVQSVDQIVDVLMQKQRNGANDPESAKER